MVLCLKRYNCVDSCPHSSLLFDSCTVCVCSELSVSATHEDKWHWSTLRGFGDTSGLPVWVKMWETEAVLHFEEEPDIKSGSLSLPLSTEFSSTSCSGLLRCTTLDGLLDFLPLAGTFFLTAPSLCFPLELVGFSDKQVTLLFCLVFLPLWSWRWWWGGWTVRTGACENPSNWGETYRECMQISLTQIIACCLQSKFSFNVL